MQVKRSYDGPKGIPLRGAEASDNVCTADLYVHTPDVFSILVTSLQ